MRKANLYGTKGRRFGGRSVILRPDPRYPTSTFFTNGTGEYVGVPSVVPPDGYQAGYIAMDKDDRGETQYIMFNPVNLKGNIYQIKIHISASSTAAENTTDFISTSLFINNIEWYFNNDPYYVHYALPIGYSNDFSWKEAPLYGTVLSGTFPILEPQMFTPEDFASPATSTSTPTNAIKLKILVSPFMVEATYLLIRSLYLELFTY